MVLFAALILTSCSSNTWQIPGDGRKNEALFFQLYGDLILHTDTLHMEEHGSHTNLLTSSDPDSSAALAHSDVTLGLFYSSGKTEVIESMPIPFLIR